MRIIPVILSLFSFLLSNIIHIPEDYATIQEGLDVAVDSDTVLVDQGIYYENIHITKSITLASYALFDDLTDWVAFDDQIFWQWQVTNENIANTIIDGSTATDDYGSCILIYSDSEDEECITPEIFGFTIQNGLGTQVRRSPDTGEESQQRLGGGILFDISNPIIEYNQFLDNGSTDITAGGGTYGTSEEEDWSFNNRDLNNRSRCDIDEFELTNNLYNGNDALYGNSFANKGFKDEFNMSESIFDVANCGIGEVSAVWVYVESEADLTLDDIESNLCAYIASDVYVDSNIESECIEEGCGYENNPFKTIAWTFAMIMPSEDNPITIHLAEGTYSPSMNGESFPIIMISNVNLIGQGEDVTIIDAEGTDRVITMDNCDNNTISDLTITGGLRPTSAPHNNGGGMFINSSNPTLTHVTIVNNTADYGGGMSLYYSNPTLANVTIVNNTANREGGGIYAPDSNPTLTHVTISENSATNSGGGMYLSYSNPTLTNVTISGNSAGSGGGMFIDWSNLILTHVTISENTANHGGGISAPDSNCTLINSIVWNNSPESIYTNPYYDIFQSVITYTDIEDGWEGEGNIDADPLFNVDFTLMDGSPCIDSGDPNLWYQDLDGTSADMGVTGGLFVLPNFILYDFGEIGDIGSNKQFTLYNYRESPITISEVNFNTSSFTTNTNFPISIAPLQTGIINIEANNSSFEFVQDEMELVSPDLPDGISVSLSVTGTEENILSANLSGIYPSANYHIVGDLTIASGDTAYLQPGTQFLFDGGVNFNIYGSFQAIGTETDSIIFDNFGDEKWKGFTLEQVSDETVFEYVRISGAEKNVYNITDEGGGMYLLSSTPTLTHVTISGNSARFGGGMYLGSSNPTLTHVTISGNSANQYGGGMYLSYSNPTLTHMTISGNAAPIAPQGYGSNGAGGGMILWGSHPILTYVTISGNEASLGGGMRLLENSNPTLTNVSISGNSANYGGGMLLSDSNPTLTLITINVNTANYEAGGMYLGSSNPTLTHVTISENSANNYGGGMSSLSYSNPTLINSIIWNNSPESIDIDSGSSSTITYSNIAGGFEGEGNIDADPLFTDPEDDDYTLMEFSPCIDAGTMIDGLEYYGSAPDMGAFEFEGLELELGDLNNDGALDVIDIVAMVNMIIALTYDSIADMNSDGVINILDIVALLNIILDN